MERTLERLRGLFVNAPELGSLIDPMNVPARERMFTPDFGRVSPLLQDALAKEEADDPVAAVFGSAALGVARAAELLARRYTLVATNVPYLARGKQGDVLRDFIELRHGEAKADLATAFVERCRSFCLPGGVYAVVTPQNWLFLASYGKLRESLLREQSWEQVARLGPGAFQTISGEIVNVSLIIVSNAPPDQNQLIAGIDASETREPPEKARLLKKSVMISGTQRVQLGNPDARISLTEDRHTALLAKYAHSFQGIATADYPR